MTETYAWRHSEGRPGSSETRLDRDRIASMADEGGQAGARMDLREQLQETHGRGASAHATAVIEERGLFLGTMIGAAIGLFVGLRLGRRPGAPRA